MRIVGIFFFFAVGLVDRFSGLISFCFSFSFVPGVFAVVFVEVIEVERRFVSPPPVVFKPAAAPPFLKCGFTGIACSGVVEIPRFVGVEGE